MHVLLVEDNVTIVKGLKYIFEKEGIQFSSKMTFQSAKDFLLKNPVIDVIILDIGLPDGDGFDLFQKVILPKKIPTIFLTAKDEEDDIVKGLRLGEDYLTKPFSSKELLARVQKIFLRNEKKSRVRVKDISFDMDKMEVLKGDTKVELTSLELKLLHLLFLNCNRVVRRSTILDKIWEWTGNDVDDHTITVYFKRIREKLGSDIIITMKGIGYRIDEE